MPTLQRTPTLGSKRVGTDAKQLRKLERTELAAASGFPATSLHR